MGEIVCFSWSSPSLFCLPSCLVVLIALGSFSHPFVIAILWSDTDILWVTAIHMVSVEHEPCKWPKVDGDLRSNFNPLAVRIPSIYWSVCEPCSKETCYLICTFPNYLIMKPLSYNRYSCSEKLVICGCTLGNATLLLK